MSNKKKLYAASAAYILGLKPKVLLRGNPGRTHAYMSVLESSKKLYDALEEGNSIEDIDKLLEEKKLKARKYTLQTGLRWPF